MADQTITLPQLLAAQPPVWPEDPFPTICEEVASSTAKLVILDDDPTGTQTVHGMPVLTSWTVQALEDELETAGPGFFILTNSRSLPAPAATALSRKIGANLRRAATAGGTPVRLISRSDSTLRGHFPDEVDALLVAMETPDLPRILVPAFFEGGRYTANDIHYVAEGQRLIPAAQTPYAQDMVFGYRHSNLRDWVKEKTGVNSDDKQPVSVTLADLRQGGPDRVAEQLVSLSPRACCIVNAMEYRDLEVLVAGLLAAEARGKQFVLRSAASLVRVRAGVTPKDLLDPSELTAAGDTGGLFVVGSYVPKTSAQLSALLSKGAVEGIEIKVTDLLDEARQPSAIAAAIAAVNKVLTRGRDGAIYTSRNLIEGTDAGSSLGIGRRVSESLITVVQGIECQPRYVVAKGGITSSDMATKGLGVRRAMVMGQVLPGVPAWQLGAEARWPGMAYIVFPGNVGDDDALAIIQERLAKA